MKNQNTLLTVVAKTSRIEIFVLAGKKKREVSQSSNNANLAWYGHVQRMAEGRLAKRALKWMPKQKRARGRLKKNWMEGIKNAMNKRNLSEGQWEDRKK
jgi:hypothetical protein